MSGFDEKTVWKWMPWAPIALGVLLTAWAAVADHGAIAAYNDAWMSGDSSFASVDNDPFLQTANLRK